MRCCQIFRIAKDLLALKRSRLSDSRSARINKLKAAQMRIAMPMQLLGVGEAAFDCFLAAFIDPLAPVGQPSCIHFLLGVLPYVARQYLGVIGTSGAALTLLTTGTD